MKYINYRTEFRGLWQEAQNSWLMWEVCKRSLPGAGHLHQAQLASWQDVAAVFFLHFLFFNLKIRPVYLQLG